MNKEKLIAVLGPTASGKTGFSIEMAKKMNSEIISCDSMLVYRGFDIGSAKPSEDEKQGIRHHMIDVLDWQDSFNVVDFISRVKPIISQINRAGKIPILVGGTGLYIKSLLEGYEFSSTTGDARYRKSLESIAMEKGKEYLHDMLKEINPQLAKAIHPNNLSRVIRALEVHSIGGEQLSTTKKSMVNNAQVVDNQTELIYDARVIGMKWERSILYDRINKRVDLMVKNGLLEEVKGLLECGVSYDCQPMRGIGYKEMVMHLRGELSYEEAIEEIKKNTRHFAKRQITWYRKMPYIEWISQE